MSPDEIDDHLVAPPDAQRRPDLAAFGEVRVEGFRHCTEPLVAEAPTVLAGHLLLVQRW